jgi:hypothetical protein
LSGRAIVRPDLQDDADTWSTAEAWIGGKLARTKMRWTRRAPRYFQQFELGIVLFLEGPQARPSGDAPARVDSGRTHMLDQNTRRALHERSLLVMTVTAFDEESAAEALRALAFVKPWTRRRADLGLPAAAGGLR